MIQIIISFLIKPKIFLSTNHLRIMSTTVLVTGAAGFIASHIVDVLLSKGYTVIGTSRTLEKGNKLTKLFKEKYPEGNLSFFAVPNIDKAGAFDEVLKSHPEITQVIHTATSITLDVKREEYKEKVIDIAIDSTVGILTSIQQLAPQVKNLVITGSSASILPFPLTGPLETVKTFTNKDWNPIEMENLTDNPMTAYVVSKKYAEKASISYIKEKKPDFNVMTINPNYVIGPQVFDGYPVNITNEFLLACARHSANDFVPNFNDLSSDVRDVANFHILAMENGEKSNGFRFFLGYQHFYDQKVIDIVVQKVPEAKLEFKGELNKKAPELQYLIQNQDSVAEVGGYEFIPFEKTVTDTFKQYCRVNGKF